MCRADACCAPVMFSDRSAERGCCDCGDPAAWSPEGCLAWVPIAVTALRFCPSHHGNTEAPLPSLEEDYAVRVTVMMRGLLWWLCINSGNQPPLPHVFTLLEWISELATSSFSYYSQM